MPNQRRKDKRNVSIPMEEELIDAIEAYAQKNGLDRVKWIKSICRKELNLPRKDKNEK